MPIHENQFYKVIVRESCDVDYEGKTYHAVNKATEVTEYESPVMINCIIAAEELKVAQEKYHSGELFEQLQSEERSSHRLN